MIYSLKNDTTQERGNWKALFLPLDAWIFAWKMHIVMVAAIRPKANTPFFDEKNEKLVLWVPFFIQYTTIILGAYVVPLALQ